MKRRTFGDRVANAWKALTAPAPKKRGPRAAKASPQASTEANAFPLEAPKPWIKISDSVLAHASLKRRKALMPTPFTVPVHPKGVAPKEATMAMDEAIIELNAWASQQLYNGAFYEGVQFLGYTYLSELAQRPEYRRISEVLATEATRKWIKLISTGQADEKKIKALEDELTRLDLQGLSRKMIELDGFFGRAHLYIDLGTTEEKEELVTPIGNGVNEISEAKIAKGSLKRLQAIEPVWCYPADYNANNPMKPDWYKPQTWFVQGTKIHASRLLTFIGREVPDMLKPAYSFGGLSLSQMAKPYVDNWLRARQSVSDLIWSFNTPVLHTDLQVQLQGDGQQMFTRLDLFTALKNNRGIMALQKGIEGEKEEFENITTPLGSLDALQAQAQEHMASVTGTPVVKLLGIQPAGLNASSQGELECWYDWVEAFQEKFLREKLTRIIHIAQLSLWGAVDPDLTFTFESLRSDDPVASASERKILAETDQILINAGSIAPEESRARIAADPESGYAGIDVEDVPVSPEQMELELGDKPDLIDEPDPDDHDTGSGNPDIAKAA